MPEYPTYELLNERVLYAIKETVGFGFGWVRATLRSATSPVQLRVHGWAFLRHGRTSYVGQTYKHPKVNKWIEAKYS